MAKKANQITMHKLYVAATLEIRIEISETIHLDNELQGSYGMAQK